MIRLVGIAIIALIAVGVVVLISKIFEWENKVTDEEAERRFKQSLEELEKSKKEREKI